MDTSQKLDIILDSVNKLTQRISVIENKHSVSISEKTAIENTRNDNMSHMEKSMDWPHFYIYDITGQVDYDSLTLPQFSKGFMHMITNINPPQQLPLQKYFITLMEDASRYQWEAVRGFHFIVGTLIEQGRLAWKDNHEILNLRRIHIWNNPDALHESTTQGHTTESCEMGASNSSFNPHSHTQQYQDQYDSFEYSDQESG